jgi:hypothetical protein
MAAMPCGRLPARVPDAICELVVGINGDGTTSAGISDLYTG